MNRDQKREAKVSFGIPLPDLAYARFRREMCIAAKIYEANHEADISTSGAIIVSKARDKDGYDIYGTSFGENIKVIDSLANAVIIKLKECIPPIKEIQEKILKQYMDTFLNTAVDIIFSENDEGKIKDIEPDLLYPFYRSEYIKSDETPNTVRQSSGILMISNETKEETKEKSLSIMVFGSVRNVINTLTLTLIYKLKEDIVPTNEARETVLTEFMSAFYNAANNEFFGDNQFHVKE